MQDSQQVIPTEPDVASPRRSDREKDIDDWSRAASEAVAEREGLKLTDDHWVVIDFLRTFYLDHGKPDSARKIADALNEAFAARGGSQFLYRLFPEGPVSQGSRIALLPLPAYSEDASFGTAF
ncbi:MAG: TusE/DsrC/DsvC family sulfur relay protein [Gammaproteobacteria bacterium]